MTSWLASLLVGVLSALVSGALGGLVASLAIDWYRVPSRDGGAGYAVLFAILFAALGGVVVGLAVSRWLAHGGPVPVWRSTVVAAGISSALLAVVAGVARWRADVPPTFEGERLHLAVEVSWPAASAPVMTGDSPPPYLMLSAGAPGAVRSSRYGMLWPADARREGDRIIIPGAVDVWTERDARLLSAHVGPPGDESRWLQIALPRRPGAAQRAWSAWTTAPAGVGPRDTEGLRYRWRIVKRSEALRVQHVGPFTIETRVDAFGATYANDAAVVTATGASFGIMLAGRPIDVSGRLGERDFYTASDGPADSVVHYREINAVAVVPGATPALVVMVDASYRSGFTYLLTLKNGALNSRYLSHVQPGQPIADRLGLSLTPAARRALLDRERGLVDDRLFAEPGLYITASSVLDTRSLAIHRVPVIRPSNELDALPPVSLAPDESRYARLKSEYPADHLLEVTIATGATRTLPLDRAPSPSGSWLDVDRAWFETYFAWEPDGTGTMRVTPRAVVTPPPRRGTLLEQPGYREYRIAGGTPALFTTFLEVLERELGAKRLPKDADDHSTSTHVVIGSDTVSVNDNDGTVVVYALNGARTLVVATIARRFDAVLATRTLDHLFR